MLREFSTVFGFVFRQQWRQMGELVMPAAFFLMFVTVFVIAQGEAGGISVLWVGTLLSLFLAAPSLYQQEWREGVLEQLVLQIANIELYVLIKALSLMILIGIPMLICVPIGMMFLGLSLQMLAPLMAALAIGIASTSLLMNFAATLMLGFGQAPLVRIGIVLPMCIPVIIFGVGASQQNPYALGWMAAYFFLLLPLCIWASARAIMGAVQES